MLCHVYCLVCCSLPEAPDGSINDRYMAGLANGHIGATAFSAKMFLNGLFNGNAGE